MVLEFDSPVAYAQCRGGRVSLGKGRLEPSGPAPAERGQRIDQTQAAKNKRRLSLK